IPRAERERTRGASRPARRAGATPHRSQCRRNSAGGLRSRPTRTVPRQDRKDQDQGRQTGRLTRLVQYALSVSARPGKRPALRLVCGALWAQEYDRRDRRRAREIGIVIPQWLPPPWLSSEPPSFLLHFSPVFSPSPEL